MKKILLPPLGELAVRMPASFAIRHDLVAAYNTAVNQGNSGHLGRVAFAVVGLCVVLDDEQEETIKLPAYNRAEPNVLGYGGAVMDVLMAQRVSGIVVGKTYVDLINWIAESLPTAEGIREQEDFTSEPTAA
ncbi:MAG: hypothetical protein AAFV53_00220 [Myxococcota bacterium]